MVSFVLKSGKSVVIHGDFNINNDDSGNLILSPIYAQPSTNKLDEIHNVLNKRLTEPTLEAENKFAEFERGVPALPPSSSAQSGESLLQFGANHIVPKGHRFR